MRLPPGALLPALLLAAAPAPASGPPPAGSFRFVDDIAPLLARHGCAAADCHGGATGRGNFKLSLFATDPAADHAALTRDLDGRRIDLADPEASLLLRKPSRQMKHGGGRIFAPGDPAYLTLLDWIRRGAPFSEGDRGALDGLELELAGGGCRVWATWSAGDGPSLKRDVTALSVFSSTHPAVAEIGDDGSVTWKGPGETWLLARYGTRSASLPLVRPFTGPPPAGPAEPLPPAHPLDAAWSAHLAALGLAPAPPAPPHILARRVYLDLAGRLPAPEEIDAFLALPEPERLARTADQLLSAPDFAGAFFPQLEQWFELGSAADPRNEDAPARTLLRRALEEDWPLTRLAQAVLLDPQGRTFLQSFEDPRDRAEAFGKTFLGLSIGCARCHNHPQDRWRQSEYLRFAACFTDSRPAAARPGSMTSGALFLPGGSEPVPPALLPVAASPAPDGLSPAEAVSWLVTDGAAGLVARNFANRVFGALTGRFLVDPPDDHRLTNPPVQGALLEALSAAFRAGEFRLRPLVRSIVTSRPYALSSDPADPALLQADPAVRYLARRESRPLTGAEFRRSASFLLGTETPPEPAAASPLAAQLQRINSGWLEQLLAAPGNAVDALSDFLPDPDARLQGLFRLVLSRPPTQAESARFLPVLADPDDPRQAARDLAFALLISREFGSLR